MNNVGLYAKAIVGALVAGGIAYNTAMSDGLATSLEWVAIISATLAALAGVWAVPTLPAKVTKYAKPITAGAIAALGALGTTLAAGAGIDSTTIVAVLIAFAGGLGLTYVTPNAAKSDVIRIAEVAKKTGIEVTPETQLEDVVKPAAPVVAVVTPAEIESASADHEVEEAEPEEEPFVDVEDVVVEDIDQEKLS